MGWRYVSFRGRYELSKRMGLYKNRFPANPPFKQYVSFQEWREGKAQFFFKDRESIYMHRKADPVLKENLDNIRDGKLLMFNSLLTDLGKNYDWVTNPDSGYKYDANKHWTEIQDYSKEAGDIKFVWEKSRFSYLYDIIRYDYHYNDNCADIVFRDILSWISNNHVNSGPNYRCSQEISLRVLNWIFALHYYRNSAVITEDIFELIQYAIYWQMDHVYKNIDFSRIAVRNNHAITETLALYLAGTFFPTMPGADRWKKNGKAWFEEEIAYQVYEDGTFLQFSMNYHRVVVQLLTWAITLSEKNDDRFSDVVYDRAKKSVTFLRTCMAEENGWLPDYGGNDGALFFKLNNAHYRDYRPQLQALAFALKMEVGIDSPLEDAGWYGFDVKKVTRSKFRNGIFSFPVGGYYIVREPGTLTFIRCGSYKDRPAQADNLHLDIWHKGENILLDAGSFKYNTDEETMRYFNGTASHNTIMLDDKDQMLKGGHFIWYYWSSCKKAVLKEDGDTYVFDGAIRAFRYVRNGIVHKRTVTKKKGLPQWEVRDEVVRSAKQSRIHQLWHSPLGLKKEVKFKAVDTDGKELAPDIIDGFASSLYGQKEKTKAIIFHPETKIITTQITVEE
jgi:Heparinase II/III-like protein/Heparinase II/III N-terminus